MGLPTQPEPKTTNLWVQKQQLIRKIYECQDLVSQQRALASKVLYILKIAKSNLLEEKHLSSLMQELLLIMGYALAKSEYMKYGHTFPLYAFVVQKGHSFFPDQPQNKDQSNQKKSNRISEAQDSHKESFPEEISQTDIQSLKTQKINKYLTELNQGRIIVQNSNCICCSQVFVRGYRVQNRNDKLGIVIGVNSKQASEVFILQRFMVAVSNQGHGVLIIGTQNKGQGLRIAGIRFQTEDQIKAMEADICKAINSVLPPSHQCILERVLTHSNFFEEDEQALEENMRICFRVRINVINSNKVNYLRVGQTYETYKLNQTANLMEVDTQNLNQAYRQENLYKMAHQNYHRRCLQQNCHEGILCQAPYINYSERFLKLMENPEMANKSSKLEVQQNQGMDTQIKIKFKYKHASFLIVNKGDQGRVIQAITQTLNQLKLQFEISKPGNDWFNHKSRCIWLLSHQLNHVPFRKKMHSIEESDVIEKGSFTFLPVFKNMEVDSSKLTEQALDSFNKKFRKLCKNEYEIQQGSGKKKMIEFYFEKHNDAVVGYLILEELGLRPYTFKNFPGKISTGQQ